eukprot:scaffold79450_cov64-Phaeocystis_antarctica.AAC.3
MGYAYQPPACLTYQRHLAPGLNMHTVVHVPPCTRNSFGRAVRAAYRVLLCTTGASPPPARLDGQRHSLLDRHAHPARADAASREQRVAGTALASPGLLRPLAPCADRRRCDLRGGVAVYILGGV